MRRAGAAGALGALLFLAGASFAGPLDDLKGTAPHALDAQTPPEDVASKCSACHSGGTDQGGLRHRPWDSWAGTMMANAARDPLYLAALTVAQQDSPGIGTFCIRCHSPQAFVRGDAADGFGNALTADDREGVACEACHRSTASPPGPYAGNAQLVWDPGAVKHGPYEGADSPAHTTLADPFTSSSALCGQCHQLENPLVHRLDAAGTDTGQPFPLDTTYAEWRASSFASGAGKKECIDCHMPRAKGDLTLSTFPTAKTRSNPRMHGFVGGNAWGISAVQAAEPALAKARELSFNGMKAAALTMLQSALRVDVEILGAAGAVKPGASFDVRVRVTNLTGHRFPTGYADGRRAFLRVELLDGSNTVRRSVEPEDHVYEAVHEARAPGDQHGQEFHIARSNTIVKDSRIPPAGFVPGPQTPIVGADYGDGHGGVRAYDEGTFHFTAPDSAPPGRLRVRATVLYQATVPGMVKELALANKTDERGSKLEKIYAATGSGAPIDVTAGSADLAFDGPQPMPPDSKGCGCALPGQSGRSSEPGAVGASLVALMLGLSLRRRRLSERASRESRARRGRW